MIKSNSNNDRLFLSRLSETYKCRSGDNVILECYVRHQRIKSIAWYAKGELVDKRGVRVWHRYEPSTGQCILYLRSVFKCDEGSYCCEATSIDNVAETLEIKLMIDNRDKSWTKVPILYMAGHVVPGGAKQLMASCKT
ncbi:unnamed protein product [Rotaria magnacalcarata]|uniref:Ig-like domain-containing protein n=2 Tax=Rotaria magnacalcarata TaxID=392030 RepID=A0A818W727_9BILA|nr:unnamed protein product [Rotaria magnacalcarata]CAF2147779.1 unnamed protein product [Rotaria magnacalcarata]CAF2178240.1 unnamed protein product [Rotaria magnacalcarata]CAF3721573.1 unnamed protein product [Rotaria magnacalcarata]CAF3733993.1 unnamed protein product [Rotaria magnacalcarata]